jgi:mono/diheme cytochrome c family protein
MKTLFGILLGVVVFLVVGGGALYAWASHADRVLLTRRIPTHEVDFPIPFPLTADEVASLREQRAAAGEEPATLSDAELASIARDRAIERGDHLVHARYGCVECHGQDFGGGVMVDDPLIGRLLGPNITAGEGGRTASFSASDWDRIVRHGIRSDGMPAAMPSTDFQLMSDQELSDIVMYIRSRPVVNKEVVPLFRTRNS